MPAAVVARNPALRIIGMVNDPVVAVLATALPDSDPIRPLASTATLAGPPGAAAEDRLREVDDEQRRAARREEGPRR